MSKYKIINETNLSNEEVGFLIDIYIQRVDNGTIYAGKEDRTTIGYNNRIYYLACKYGIRYNTFIVKEGKINA